MRRFVTILPLVVVVAMAAAPQAAAAPRFTGFVEEAVPSAHLQAALVGEQTETLKYTPTSGPQPVFECTELGLPGEAETGTDGSIAVRPEATACESSISLTTTEVRMNGCGYDFFPGSSIGEGRYQGTMDVVCPEGEQIEIEVDGGGLTPLCLNTIPPQEGLGPVYFETEGSPDLVRVELQVEGISNTMYGEKEFCVTEGEKADGTYQGEFELRGFNTANEEVDFSVTGAEPLFTAFGAVPEEGEPVATSLSGSLVESSEFVVEGESDPVTCEVQEAMGTIFSEGAAEPELQVAYPQCHWKYGVKTDVSMNGCTYRFEMTEQVAEREHEGTVDFVCPAGKKIETRVTSGESTLCLDVIPPQEDLGPVYFRLRADKVPHQIEVEADLESVQSTTSGGFFVCGVFNGEHFEGRYRASLALAGEVDVAKGPVNLLIDPAGEESAARFTGVKLAPASPIVPKHTTVKAAQATAHQYVPASGFSPLKCGTASLEGTLETGSGLSLTAGPSFAGCATASMLTAHTRLNGCSYRLRPTKRLSADKYQGVTDILCPGSEEIEFEVTASGGGLQCLNTIPAQENLGPVYFEDQTAATPDDVVVDFQIANLRSKTSGGLSKCGVANGEHTAGTYSGTSTARGFNTGAEQIEFQVTGE